MANLVNAVEVRDWGVDPFWRVNYHGFMSVHTIWMSWDAVQYRTATFQREGNRWLMPDSPEKFISLEAGPFELYWIAIATGHKDIALERMAEQAEAFEGRDVDWYTAFTVVEEHFSGLRLVLAFTTEKKMVHAKLLLSDLMH